mgnify:CR=1 FL=1
MYEIDYVFDEMSLFHIEELFNVSILKDSPDEVFGIKKELGYRSTQSAGVVFQDLQWTGPMLTPALLQTRQSTQKGCIK